MMVRSQAALSTLLQGFSGTLKVQLPCLQYKWEFRDFIGAALVMVPSQFPVYGRNGNFVVIKG